MFAHINISLTSIDHSFAVATFQQTLSRNRRNGGGKLLMSKETQAKKKAAAEAAESTRATRKSDVSILKPQQVQELPLTCTSLKPDSTSIERPTKASKNNHEGGE